MDLKVFQQILLDTLSDNQETIAQAENNLNEMKQADYMSFLNFALQSIENPISARIPPISITLIYREVRNGYFFNDEKILVMFLQVFCSNITSELLSPDINDTFKMMLSSILSILHIYVYKKFEDVTIPTYILTSYTEIPNLRPYLMNCVYEIAIADPDLGGFNFEDLLTILFDDMPNQSLFIPRIHLYFALAKNKSDLEIFHQMFESLIIQPMLNPDFSSAIIQSVANFADINGYFFASHAALLFEKLINLSLNQENDTEIRDYAILCMISIVRNAPEMFKTFENFYENVIAPLVLVVSEITDDDPWDYNPNDDRPCQNALDAIGAIDEIIESRDGIGIIFQMYQGVLNPEAMSESNGELLSNLRNGPESWQAKYALISSLSSMMSPNCNEQIVSSLLDLIIPLINAQTHPRIRVAIYQFIKNATKFTQNAQDISSIIDVTIQSALAEDMPFAKQNAFKSIVKYFKNIIVLENTEFVCIRFFAPYFSRFLEELSSQPPEISKYVVQCVGLMAKAAKKNFTEPIFKQTTNTLVELLHHSTNISYSAKIVSAFATCLYYFDIYKSENSIKYRKICLFFLHNALQIYGNDNIDEEESQDLTDSICIFLNKSAGDASPLVSRFFPHLIELASKNIPIEQSQTLGGIYGLISMYIQIPSQDSSIKLYVPRNDVIEVKQSLQILGSLMRLVKSDEQILKQVMNIAKNWICSNYFIEDLVFSSFEVLHIIVTMNHENVEIIDFYLQCFVQVINIYPNFNLLWIIYKKVSYVLGYAKSANWKNVELFGNLLKGLPNLIDHAIQLKLNTTEAMITYNSYDHQDKKLAFIDTLLGFVNEIINQCYSISADMTNQCLSPEVLPKMIECLQNYPLLSFAACFLTKYYIAMGPDLSIVCEFIQFLVNTIMSLTNDETKDDTTEHLFEYLGDICFRFDFAGSPQFSDYLVNFFSQYLLDILEVGNEEEDEANVDGADAQISKKEKEINDTISDNANVAFAKFLLKNLKNTSNQAQAIYLWNASKPLWGEAIYDSHYYYQLLVNLIVDNSIFQELGIYWVEDYMPQILNGMDENLYEKIINNSDEFTYGRQNLLIIAAYLRKELETERGVQTINETIVGNGVIQEEDSRRRENTLRKHLNLFLSLPEPE